MAKIANSRPAAEAVDPIGRRILGAAFTAFTQNGYARTSTLEIATRAKVSKRDLYARFATKQAMLAACIKSRAERMRPPADLPVPRDRSALNAILAGFGATLVRETCEPVVIAVFRLAIAEAASAPEVAAVLETVGRQAARRSLVDLLARAQAAGLIGAGEPAEMSEQYFGLLLEDLMVSQLLGIAPAPKREAITRRAAKAAEAFLALHPAPGASKGTCLDSA